MPREVSITTRLTVSADLYWALRSDRGFDKYCAECEGSEFVLESMTTNEQETPPTEVVSTYCYPAHAMPSLLRPLLGENSFALTRASASGPIATTKSTLHTSRRCRRSGRSGS